ncbi:MAG TPA: hypothetical protein PKH39_19670 [Woeseiaceae bacterium]|nr:hypothetical protein [Woeseiaceae bacterium]
MRSSLPSGFLSADFKDTRLKGTLDAYLETLCAFAAYLRHQESRDDGIV